ncbi:MAG: ABC transporter ATP-binding protein [Dehalococcoidales bacterium]|nr:ABC transporter ATP-binding protein [Dehalococcoidales bacterium]
MPDDVIIKTNGLTKRFGSPLKGILAVDNLNIEVERGNIFGFLGPNASGKTTTIGMLLGLIRPTSGSIELFGQDTKQDLPSLLRRTSAVLENSPFYPYLSGCDNLEVFARTMGGVERERIDEVLVTVGLEKRAKNKAKTYSLGMRQRLSIAVALLSNPELLILDEPTNGLDPEGIIEIRELIRSLGKEGKTIFLSSHLLHEVERVCNHVAILNKGKVITQGPVKELLRRNKMLQIRVSDADMAVSMLMDIEWIKTIETGEDKVIFIEAPEDKYPDINELLVKKGIRVSEMKTSEDSLEDFFLDVIDEETKTGKAKNA